MDKKILMLSLLALFMASCGKELEQTVLPVVKPGNDIASEMDGIYVSRQIFQPKELDVAVEHFISPEPPFPYDIVYTYDETNFPNPERGPYFNVSYSFHEGNVPEAATVERLASARKDGTSLVFTFLYLCDYVDKEILSDDVIRVMREHFTNLRKSGCKAVCRVAYSWNDKWPVQEPPADMIASHVKQLKPVFQEFGDVIYVMQAGLIGTYGEWAYTTNVKSDEDHAEVVKALLDALPENRTVAIRTPSWKRRLLTVFNADGNKVTERDTITVAEAFGPSDKARLAIHNDRAFVNGNDGGTFGSVYDRHYVRTESNYYPYGGESCYQNNNEYCECIPSYKNLRTYHWSYLSNHYAIRELWQNEGCYNDASSRVGYRFVLNGAAFHGTFGSEEDFGISLCLSNYGFASLINRRKMEFVIANQKNPKEKYVYPLDKDPREWKGGKAYVFTDRIVLPSALQKGAEYNLYLNLPDESPNLYDNPEYSVRFANRHIWEEKTGYNLIASFKAEY